MKALLETSVFLLLVELDNAFTHTRGSILDTISSSTLTATYLITATTRVGSLLVATDLQRDALEQVSGHAGVEAWAGSIALETTMVRGGFILMHSYC